MMRLALLLCSAMLWSVPVVAQESDPLAPLEQSPDQQPADQQPAVPATTQPADIKPALPPAPPRVIPKDWRGVLLAINAGDWEGARLGIEALPDGLLKPYARAELYTA